MTTCAVTVQDRRNLFWTTQPEGCGTDRLCRDDCSVPGLSLASDGTIVSDNWITSLVINMLMTDGREENTACGFAPGSQGGHWSESYITGPAPNVGTLMRTVKPQGSVNQIVTMLKAFAQSTLDKLVERGVAFSVNVEAKYVGNNRFALDVEVFGASNTISRVGLSADRLSNEWIWQV